MRNLGNITAPRLFNRAYAGTKLLIEDYITQVALAIEYVTALPASQSYESGFTSQAKLDLMHDTRQAFGRSTLVLQGGAIFGLCHLGVVKALHLRGLLPRIITGTATGALIAALVGIHTEDELLDFLNGDGIDLTAFARHRHATNASIASDDKALIQDYQTGILQTLLRRTRRYIREGYFLDVNVLEECVRANVGDLTFEEAYARTKRVLNITVATSGRGGVPNLLNYLTAPNVVRSPHPPPVPTTTDPSPPAAHLVRGPRLQRLLHDPLLARHPQMQRRNGRHRALGVRARNHLPLLAPRLLRRPRLAPVPHRRALQRQPLPRLPGAAAPRALPARRPPAAAARPRPAPAAPPRRQPRRRRHAPAPTRGPPPPAPGRRVRPAARAAAPLAARRDRPRRGPHARAGARAARFLEAAGESDEGELGVLDPEGRAERLAGGRGVEGEVRGRGRAGSGVSAREKAEAAGWGFYGAGGAGAARGE